MPYKLTLKLTGTSLTVEDVEDLREEVEDSGVFDVLDVYMASSEYEDESVDKTAQIAIIRPELSGETWTITHVNGEAV